MISFLIAFKCIVWQLQAEVQVGDERGNYLEDESISCKAQRPRGAGLYPPTAQQLIVILNTITWSHWDAFCSILWHQQGFIGGYRRRQGESPELVLMIFHLILNMNLLTTPSITNTELVQSGICLQCCKWRQNEKNKDWGHIKLCWNLELGHINSQNWCGSSVNARIYLNPLVRGDPSPPGASVPKPLPLTLLLLLLLFIPMEALLQRHGCLQNY